MLQETPLSSPPPEGARKRGATSEGLQNPPPSLLWGYTKQYSIIEIITLLSDLQANLQFLEV